MKIIYADGSSLGNPGKAGFGVVAMDTERKLLWEYGAGFPSATNNQMELAACIFALKLLKESNLKKGEKVELRLDSKYVISGATVWSKNWLKNNWKTANKKTVLNKDEWLEILNLISEIPVKINWVHVYGHTGEEWNERVDEIAKAFASDENIKLRKATTINI